MPNINLKELLFPLTPEDFFKSHWPANHLFIPGDRKKLRILQDLPQLQDLESILAARVLQVRACLPDFNDEYSSVLVDPSDALKLYRNGMTLVFDGMQNQSSVVADALRNIRADLGLATGGEQNDLTRARAMAYATPAGGLTRLHFDANANFVFQLKGRKRWSLAPNASVENPTDRYTCGSGELPIVLERQCQSTLLDELPNGHLEIAMEAGSVLFVPRGYWHETETEEDSLSLNFTYSQPTWADILTLSLREYLHHSIEWRALADGLEGPGADRIASARARFGELFQQLSAELPGISSERLLAEAGFLKGEHVFL